MTDDYLWKIRCPESGYLIGECNCTYCYDEFELDSSFEDGWFDEEDEDYWLLEDFDVDEEYDDDWEVEEII